MASDEDESRQPPSESVGSVSPAENQTEAEEVADDEPIRLGPVEARLIDVDPRYGGGQGQRKKYQAGGVDRKEAAAGNREQRDVPQDEQTPQQPGGLQHLFFGKLPLETETTRFILVNLLDYFMTYLLLMGAGGAGVRFVESNPVARYFIESWGPVKGMLGFKLGLVTFVCLVAQVIATRRPRAATLVLNFGTLAVSCVVIYSLALLLRH